MIEIPVCCNCRHATWLRGLPATRDEPAEPPCWSCGITGELIPEGQEPMLFCAVLDAYEAGYAAGLRAAKHNIHPHPEDYTESFLRGREAEERW